MPVVPIGLPGLAVLAIGIGTFLGALLHARHRTRSIRRQPSARRDRGSWVGILLQAAGIAIVGLGPVDVRLDPLGAHAWLAAAAVAGLMSGAVALFVAATRAMGANWAIVAQTRRHHQLVTTRPFAHVRNPIYVALFLLMLAVAIGYGHYVALVPGVMLYAAGTMARVRREERLLRAQFGPAYDAYASRVRRFVPGVI